MKKEPLHPLLSLRNYSIVGVGRSGSNYQASAFNLRQLIITLTQGIIISYLPLCIQRVKQNSLAHSI